MKCILSRGHAPGHIDPECLHITAALEPLQPKQGSLLHIAWSKDAQPSAYLMQSSVRLACELTQVDHFWRVDLPGKVRIWFAACPWGQLPDLKYLSAVSQVCDVYVPWRGWQNEIWYDGPLIWLEKGQAQAIVLPGADGQLLLDANFHQELGAMEWYQQRAAHAWKISLAWAMRERLDLVETQVYHLHLKEYNAANILALLALRLAFPEIRFCWLEHALTRPPQWRRLAQNLNIELRAASVNESSAKILQVDPLCQSWPVPAILGFLHELQAWIPFIPARLLAALS